MTRNILLVTNIWNERERIPRLFEAVENQTILPKMWVWLDDGSNDDSSKVIIKEALRSQVPVIIYYMPMKDKGNMDTIGLAYGRFMPRLYHLDFDYMTILDVDSSPYPDFFELQCRLMECNPNVGISGGQVDVDPKRENAVMGLGMFIRWDFIKRIKRWWNFSPDSMLNVLCVFSGYNRLLVNDLIIPASPSLTFKIQSQFKHGRYAVMQGASRFMLSRRFLGNLRKRGVHAAVYWVAGILVQLSRPYRLNYKEISTYYSGRVKHKYLRSETLNEALHT